jgi:Flp pilus assembly protein TadD
MSENPLDAYVPARYGMCLDGMGRTAEATPYFDLAEQLDPNNAKIAYFMAGHCIDRGDYLAARRWLTHSLSMQRDVLAISSLALVNETLTRLGYKIK